jgi:hypothetical protein
MESVPEGESEGAGPGEIDDRRHVPDRRGWSRRKMLKAGRTFWPNGDSSGCLVHNLSETGAQLEFQGPAPNFFDLVVDGDPRRRSCSVVWRKERRVGVTFNEESQAASRVAVHNIAEYKRYSEACRLLADRAALSDREILLEMSVAWISVIRHLQSKRRRAGV